MVARAFYSQTSTLRAILISHDSRDDARFDTTLNSRKMYLHQRLSLLPSAFFFFFISLSLLPPNLPVHPPLLVSSDAVVHLVLADLDLRYVELEIVHQVAMQKPSAVVSLTSTIAGRS
jgi:hypothetical protein